MMKKLIETNEIGGEHIIDRSKSIFNAIKSTSGQPFEWLTQPNADTLDVEYYLNHSGQKWISPMFRKLLDLQDVNAIQQIAKIIINKFEDKWNKLFEAFIESEYKPLENYSMEEVETPDITKESTENTKTKVETSTENDKTEAKVHGFNSVEGVPSGSTERNGKVVVEGGADDNEVHREDTETGTRTLTRHGNIGVTSSQQMLTQEIELRSGYNFVEMLFKDVDSVLTLLVY